MTPKIIESEPQEEISRGSQIYHDLRDALRLGGLKAGEKIREIDICEKYGVSRTPAREALKQLYADGFLVSAAGGRLAVARMDIAQAEELYEMREVVEGLAARLAARNATTLDLDALSRLMNARPEGETDELAFLRINDQFHQKIYEMSRNRYVMRTADILLNSIGMIRISSTVGYEFKDTSLTEHQEIFEAIERGDTQAAEEVARRHVRNGRRRRILLLSQAEGAPPPID